MAVSMPLNLPLVAKSPTTVARVTTLIPLYQWQLCAWRMGAGVTRFPPPDACVSAFNCHCQSIFMNVETIRLFNLMGIVMIINLSSTFSPVQNICIIKSEVGWTTEVSCLQVQVCWPQSLLNEKLKNCLFLSSNDSVLWMIQSPVQHWIKAKLGLLSPCLTDLLFLMKPLYICKHLNSKFTVISMSWTAVVLCFSTQRCTVPASKPFCLITWPSACFVAYSGSLALWWCWNAPQVIIWVPGIGLYTVSPMGLGRGQMILLLVRVSIKNIPFRQTDTLIDR